jgi:hypothetical protein
MPYMPLRFTLVMPAGHVQSGGDAVFNAHWSAVVGASNVGLFFPYNLFDDTGAGTNAPTCSFTPGVTAPDGTTTAYKMVEAATTGFHRAQAFMPADHNGGWTFRHAIVAKAAERTRVCLQIIVGTNGDANWQGNKYCTTVFDLAGGQIGVPNTLTDNFNNGNFIAPGPAAIYPLGSGWYVCYMDVLSTFDINNTRDNIIVVTAQTDAGIGTGALNISYAGNGSSGINVWKASVLPARAWALSGQRTFFDDFNDNTLGNFDLAHTKDPTKTWFLDEQLWPEWVSSGGVQTPASCLSASGSILTLNTTPVSGHNTDIGAFSAAVYDGAGGHIGNKAAPVPPFLIEVSQSASNPTVPDNQGAGALWTSPYSSMLTQFQANPEIDYTEFTGKSPGPHLNADESFWWINGGFIGNVRGSRLQVVAGVPQWQSNWTYQNIQNGESDVSYLGVVYQPALNDGGNNQGNNPLSSGSWTPLSTTFLTTPGPFPDLTQLQTYSFLVLSHSVNYNQDPGYFCAWNNGIPCMGPYRFQNRAYTFYSPNSPTFVPNWSVQSYCTRVGCHPSTPMSFDWISIRQ